MEYVPKINILDINDGEKWYRKNIFEIPPCAKPFMENLFYFVERWIFAKTANSVIEMTSFAHGGIKKKLWCMNI